MRSYYGIVLVEVLFEVLKNQRNETGATYKIAKYLRILYCKLFNILIVLTIEIIVIRCIISGLI